MFKFPDHAIFQCTSKFGLPIRNYFEKYSDEITSFTPHQEWISCAISRGVNTTGIDDRPRQTTVQVKGLEFWFWGADITSHSKTTGDKAMLEVFELQENISRAFAPIISSGTANDDQSQTDQLNALYEASLNASDVEQATGRQKDGCVVSHAIRAKTGEIEVIQHRTSYRDIEYFARSKNTGIGRFIGITYNYYRITGKALEAFYQPTRSPEAEVIPFPGQNAKAACKP